MTLGQWDTPAIDQGDLPIIVQNGAQELDKSGGINGVTVKTVKCNTEFNENIGLACVRQAISEHVVAIVGGFADFPAAYFPLLEQAGIAWIGDLGEPGTPSDQSSVSFVTAGITFQTYALSVLAAESSKCTSVVAMIDDTGTTPPNEEAFLAAPFAHAHKASVFKGIVNIPQTSTDLAPAVAQASAYHPDCIVTSATTNVYAELLSAMQGAGVVGAWTVYAQQGDGVTPTFVADNPKATNGWIVDTFYQPLDSSSQWQQYKQVNLAANDLNATYRTNLSEGVEQFTWIGWQAFVKIAKGIKGPVTAASFLKAASSTCALSLPGLAPDFNFCKQLPDKEIAREFDTSFAFLLSQNGQQVALPGKTGLYNMYAQWAAAGKPALPLVSS